MPLISAVMLPKIQPLTTVSVVWLLRAIWIAAILPILIAFIPSRRVSAFRDFLHGMAQRGKTAQSSSKKFCVPQKFFCHFYVLAVLWTTCLLLATWHYAYKTAAIVSEPSLYSSIASHLTGVSHEFTFHKSHSSSRKYRYSIWRSVFLLLLFEAHVVRRLIESIYVFKYSPSAQMNICGYLSGVCFYLLAPLSLCDTYASEVFEYVANTFVEFLVKGKEGMQIPDINIWGHVSPLLQLKLHVWIGAAVSFWGWIHQSRCHTILGSLRENGRRVDEYVIPYGDWFEYVSSPHYFAEIIIYGGFVIATGFTDVTVWLLFGFVVANLAFTATETQKWYIQKFENYPINRHAIIPFFY